MSSLFQELRYALRALRMSPGFTAAAVLTLAIGIGASTAVFSVVDQLLIRPLGYHEPDRIVRLLSYRQKESGTGTISAPDFADWITQSRAFASAALYDEYSPTLTSAGVPRKLQAASVSASYFDVLGVQPAIGRFFLPAEDAGGSSRVVLSWSLWRDAFGADPAVVGRVIDLSGFPYTVVGVAPPMEDPGLSGGAFGTPQLWRSTPRYFRTAGRGGHSFTAIARLKPGVSAARAEAQLNAVQQRLAGQFPTEDADRVVRARILKDTLVGSVRPVLWVLFAAVGLVLLIACTNVANLLLFRAAGRAREIGVRTALGASRGRIIRQLMGESLLLAGIGAAGGVLLAGGIIKAMVALAAGQLPRAGGVHIDARALLFGVAAAGGCALVFGLAPALHTARVDVLGMLGQGGRGMVSQRGGRLRAGMVAVQVAIAVVVMLGAGLLLRSLARLQAINPGLAAERVLVLRADPPGDPYDPSTEAGEAALLGLYTQFHERIAALPGVQSVGMTDLLPMSGSFNSNGFRIVGRPVPGPGEVPSAETRAVSPGYFATMGIPLLQGRGIQPSDDAGSGKAVVVNQAFVRRYLPKAAPLNSRLRVFAPDAAPARIVGVVGDVTQFALDRPADPVIYVPLSQAPDYMQGEPWIVVRTAGEPAALTAAVRRAIQEVEPHTPVYAAQPMTAVIGATLARPRFHTVLLAAFAAIAFILASLGVYGMVAYAASRRLPELGLRLALGAEPANLRRFLIGGGLRPVLIGAGAGLLGGLLAVRLLRGMVYGVAATDPATFIAVPLALITVATLAAWLPARRASRVDPIAVLREE